MADTGGLFDVEAVAAVDVFAAIRDKPGNVSMKTIEREVLIDLGGFAALSPLIEPLGGVLA